MKHRILFVCKDNTCRSPMMQALLIYHLEELEVTNVIVESAGTLERANGSPINPKADTALQSRGILFLHHASRFVGNLPLDEYDLIYCVEEEEAEYVRTITTNPYVVVINKDGGGIPNPYNQSDEVYEDTAAIIESEIMQIADSLC